MAGVRAVPFRIGAGSVRYFFAGDLGEARRLLASFNDYLGRQARPAARGPWTSPATTRSRSRARSSFGYRSR